MNPQVEDWAKQRQGKHTRCKCQSKNALQSDADKWFVACICIQWSNLQFFSLPDAPVLSSTF